VRRLLAYSDSIPTFRAGVKEWSWRDGWWVQAAARHGVVTPRYTEMLEQARALSPKK
jgi:hypothetical protein